MDKAKGVRIEGGGEMGGQEGVVGGEMGTTLK